MMGLCTKKTSAESTRQLQAQGRFLRHQYTVTFDGFGVTNVCADFQGDGTREIVYARKPETVAMIRASDGKQLWTQRVPGVPESVAAFDIDGDGELEIVYTTSARGWLYVLDRHGKVLRSWDSGDSKIGNSAVVLDADADGTLDGFFGTRTQRFVRLNMQELTLVSSRSGWSQCGCYTSAIDIDSDGRWDLFAGTGDDFRGKGVVHRIDPLNLESIWLHKMNDNASSGPAVIVDIDGDGQLDVLKSVDNYGRDDAHDSVHALSRDGRLKWMTPELRQERTPNVADLDGDGEVEIVGLEFGGEIFCLDSQGRLKWKRDLRPEFGSEGRSFTSPVLCDVDGDRDLEILAMTNGAYFDGKRVDKNVGSGIIFALSADGEILDRLDLGSRRAVCHAFVCNVDADPFLEYVVSGPGGVDVIETRGFGANTENFQHRRNYTRNNIVPWAYEDSYFIERGTKRDVVNLTDNLVLEKTPDGYAASGQFTTELLTLPPNGFFDWIEVTMDQPQHTQVKLDILDKHGQPLREDVKSGSKLDISEPVHLDFHFSTTDRAVTPKLDAYVLEFDRRME